MDTYDISPLTRRWGAFVFCAFEITPRLVGWVKLSLTLLIDYRVEKRVWKNTMTYSYSRILPSSLSSLSPVLVLWIHVKSVLMLCPCESEIDVHIKVTKTNCILYFPASVPLSGSISTRHQGATSIYCTYHPK